VIFGLLLLGVLSGVTGYATYNELGGEAFEELHEAVASAMLALVALHVGGVIVSSLLHRENLVGSMLSGYKAGQAAEGIRNARWLTGSLLVAGAIALWVGVL
jgi:cytochrome b